MNAATGEVLKVYKNTTPTQEVAYDQGILFLNVGDRCNSSAYNIVKLKNKPFVEGADPAQPFYGGGFREGYAPEIKDKENPVSAILAIDPKTGQQLWAIRDIRRYTAGSLSIKGNHAVYQAANGLFCDTEAPRQHLLLLVNTELDDERFLEVIEDVYGRRKRALAGTDGRIVLTRDWCSRN